MKNPNEIPAAAEFGLLRAWLAVRGLTPAQLAQSVGAAPNGRTRRVIAVQLLNWLKSR